MLSRASFLANRSRAAFAASSGVRSFSSTNAALGEQYDVVVVGGGPGGYVAAIKAGQLGLKTACVEMRGTLGGTCLNVGCIPSKALLQSSHHFHDAKEHFGDHGIVIGDIKMDIDKMQESKAKTVSGLTGGIEHLLKKHKVDYFKGKGSLSGPNGVSVALNDGGSESLDAKNIILATGSEVTPLPPVPVDNAAGKIVDSTGALDISKIPETMAVVGGGVIGLEMGSVWSRLGTKVTVVEFMDRLCPAMDHELTKKFQTTLKKQGFKFQLKTKVTKSVVGDDGVTLTTEAAKGGKEKEEKYDIVLVATGRRPYTDGLGLEGLGIQTDKLGRIEVDEHFKTAVPSIYAIGDCIDGPMLAHKAEEEGIAAVETIAGFAGHVNYDAIPGVIYTYPEVAAVGKTEEELKEAGIEFTKGSFPFQANSRARANGSSEGFVKVLADKATDRILGVHIMGPNAGEMIAEGVLGMEYGASSEDIARTCHAHPTLSEAFKEACMDTYDKPIHF
uniref:Dihydrolipoyl dehydrogenase n=1 Tax=Helicotheca tamesis TaxID=374047 RepID=A0A7S2IJB8_9STRA|mmetsp:Transcript_9714/g.13603  ORF Transcript_9714/g.13603 Transcript_9714/m.13603 type:complete len:502 (+) Transcript_9714:52-1557(+)|eukprot:CAMPEP_0185724144 /NCGR_PEP_ID=MMETSP1171-20130828/709_1 /TAXON_ID=374046 /ORGANISM="Helicotheca tamensis, Strain CCMP826" /LENGTH=501 /DNA_ID=CAMNT_0028391929 /DNA_START=16 /DNA_END=1521 /DNA_ORIENTATION=+